MANKDNVIADDIDVEELLGGSVIKPTDTSDEDLVSSNDTLLHYEVEAKPGVLPTSPKWKAVVPNSYSATGGTLSNVVPGGLDPSGQYTKGSPTQVAATAGFEVDLKYSNLTNFMPGFFRAPAVTRANTYDGKSSVSATTAGVNGTYTGNFTTANGWPTVSGYELLVAANNFANPQNNGLKAVDNVTSGALRTKSGSLVAESSTKGRLAIAGMRISSTIAWTAGAAGSGEGTVTAVPSGFLAAMQLVKGEWIKVEIGERAFWGRVVQDVKSGTTIRLNSLNALDGTNLAVNIPASTDVANIYVANCYINNRLAGKKPSDYFYQFKRTIVDNRADRSVDTVVGTQVQTVTASVPNTLAVNIPTADKVTSQIDFISRRALTNDKNTITTSNEVQELDETIYNTSDNVSLISLFRQDGSSLFADLTDITFNFENGITPRYKVGSKFAIGASRGKFGFNSTGTAYFSTQGLAAVQAAQQNLTVSGVAIIQNESGGIGFDFPASTVPTADINIAVDEPVTITMGTTGYRGSEGYTLRMMYFPWLSTTGGEAL